MAYNLINEPVCRNCAPGTVARWVAEMAPFVKGLAPQQLVTVGEEGFWSTTAASVPFNPAHGEASWASEYTQDFVADHRVPEIDFATFHAWPDLWAGQDLEFFKRWIAQHKRGENK
jgi:mannan endo-1,4-beta-mannosidase